MGTFVAFEAHAPSRDQGIRAIDAAARAFERVEALMHPTRSGSDLAALNTAPLQTPNRVHAWTFELLELSLSLHRLSGGVFDPCLPAAAGRLRDIELSAPDQVVVHEHIALDLGGIAKGFAIDRAIEAMQQAGCSTALVNAGGDLRASGDHRQRISCRFPSGECRHIELQNMAMAVSRADAPDRPAEHQGYYRREPALPDAPTPASAAAILAPTAVLADALTKCAMLCETRVFAAILGHFGATRLF